MTNNATESGGQQHPFSRNEIVRRVMLGQILFSAGNVLTGGTVLNYFLHQFQFLPFLFSILQIIPETSQALSALSRPVTLHLHSRKRIWILGIVLGRLIALAIPLALMLPAASGELSTYLMILSCLSGWYLCQGVAYVNYISWISDLVPDVNWGHLFSRRQLASIAAMLVVPLGLSLLRSKVLAQLGPSANQWTLAACFCCGNLLCMASVLPLLKVADVPWIPLEKKAVWNEETVFDRWSFRWLLAGRWWLAFFQGLTQTAMFFYTATIIGVGVETALAFTALTNLIQLPAATWGGRLCDRGQDKRGLIIGLLIVSCGMPLLMSARAENWWPLGGVSIVWGAFGAVNVCGINLCLKLVPRGDNARQFALYDQVSGLIAGLAGIAGGWAIDQLQIFDGFSNRAWCFQTLFLVSWIGRVVAILWLLPVRQPQPVTAEEDSGSVRQEPLPSL
ncbi:MFS transporter [Planctomicrobium sp. SH664]|uniref:MFS transporter n=1 Tax=Planctomicrobium sp. SH664 TaxID=3448125 RepID=UPI003F5C2690